MQINTQFIESEHLIVQKMSGEWSFDDFGKDHQNLLDNPCLKNVTKGIVDLRGLHIEMNFKELSKLEKIRKTLQKNIQAIIVVDQPSSTAFAHLFKQHMKDFPVEYCSTIKHAVTLLNLEKPADYVENFLMEM